MQHFVCAHTSAGQTLSSASIKQTLGEWVISWFSQTNNADKQVVDLRWEMHDQVPASWLYSCVNSVTSTEDSRRVVQSYFPIKYKQKETIQRFLHLQWIQTISLIFPRSLILHY